MPLVLNSAPVPDKRPAAHPLLIFEKGDSMELLISAGLILAIVLWGVVAPDSLGTVFDTALAAITRNFGWFYLWVVLGLVVMALILAFSRYGDLKLGQEDDEPEFSIGAWFAMQALQTQTPEKALLVSPVVDMEKLILALMQQAGVTEEQLRAAGEIPTDFGETLSWPYLCWVREHPLHWKVPTQVLYADTDPLTGHTAMEQFRQQTGAHLTILEGGEHWFHTETQLAALQSWESCHL